MQRIRTITEAINYIKEKDPETALTKFALRDLIITKKIPAIMRGKKYLISLDVLERYLERPESVAGYTEQPTIRPINKGGWIE